jgi:hypothetical protein
MQDSIADGHSHISAILTDSSVGAALRTQETFDRTQVAWLMSQAMRWGYESRVDEENGCWPDVELMFNAGEAVKAAERKRLRDAYDAAARLPRPGDHRGGPVVWAEDADMRVAA